MKRLSTIIALPTTAGLAAPRLASSLLLSRWLLAWMSSPVSICCSRE